MAGINLSTKIADTQIEQLTAAYHEAKSVGNLALASQIAKAKQAWLCVGEAITDHSHQKQLNDEIDAVVKDIQKSLVNPSSKWLKIAAGTCSIIGGVACFGTFGAACLPSQMVNNSLAIAPNFAQTGEVLKAVGSTGQGVVQAGSGMSTLSAIPESREQSKQEAYRNVNERSKNVRQEKSQSESMAMNRKEQLNQALKEEENSRSRALSDMARS